MQTDIELVRKIDGCRNLYKLGCGHVTVVTAGNARAGYYKCPFCKWNPGVVFLVEIAAGGAGVQQRFYQIVAAKRLSVATLPKPAHRLVTVRVLAQIDTVEYEAAKSLALIYRQQFAHLKLAASFVDPFVKRSGRVSYSADESILQAFGGTT